MKRTILITIGVLAILTMALTPIITTQPISQTNLIGSNVTFTLQATNALTYKWYYNRTGQFSLLPISNTNSYKTNVNTKTIGTYYVEVGNASGSVTSSIVSLVATSKPNVLVTLHWLPSTNVDHYEIWSTTDLLQPMTLLTNAGLSTNLTLTYPKSGSRFFDVKAYHINTNNSVTLGWNSYNCVDESVNIYHLYQGSVSGEYTNVFTIACSVNTLILSGLQSSMTYYFTLAAVNSFGLESPFSDEVQYTVPVQQLTSERVPRLITVQ